MKPPEKKIWFPAKTYGWGWDCRCWQGWSVLSVFTILMALGAGVFTETLKAYPDRIKWIIVGYVSYMLLLMIAIFAICWWKGEPARWRWGKEPDKDGK